MELTSYEKKMLNGDFGMGLATALKIQVAIGESFDAKRMLKINRAHVALSNQEADLWFVEKLLSQGAFCQISPTVNPGFSLEHFRDMSTVSKEDISIMERTQEAYKNIGAKLTYSCTPYLGDNIPRFGEIVAYSESSATPYINSVWGARSNRESAQSALCAAITGRVPEYGLIFKENRVGDIWVDIKADITRDFDYQLLGYCADKIGHGVPVFTGLPNNISSEALMNLVAQLNTAGAVPMCHIVGVTPEACTFEEAFGGKSPKKKVVIDNEDLEKVHNMISGKKRKIDFVMIGCPHITIEQVYEIAKLLKEKKLSVEMWILTSSHTRELAKRMELLDIIEKAGGNIVADTCVDQPCWAHLEGKTGITDSPKCAYYTKRRGMEFVVEDLYTCVKAAVEGEIN